MYNKRKFGQHCQAELKRLSKELLVGKRKALESLLRSVLQNEARCWTEYYKYIKRRKGKRDIIRPNIVHYGKVITDPIEKAKSRKSYYASLFSCESNNPQTTSTKN